MQCAVEEEQLFPIISRRIDKFAGQRAPIARMDHRNTPETDYNTAERCFKCLDTATEQIINDTQLIARLKELSSLLSELHQTAISRV